MATIQFPSAESIAESILGPIVDGYIECPGKHLHSNANHKRDCKVFIDDGAPTAYCVHTSCSGIIAEKNRELRSAIGRQELGQRKVDAAEVRLRNQERERQERLRAKAEALKLTLFSRFAGDEWTLRRSSPTPLDCAPTHDWRLLLGLFSPDAVLWIGNTYDSANETAEDWKREKAARHFRPVADWLNEPEPSGNFTCPSLFKNSSHSRSNENVIRRPFLVLESDTLSKADSIAVFDWMRQWHRLRAVVCTGGKSLHGWFDYPSEPDLAQLRVILPVLGCDPALFKASQPCRLPGVWRSEKTNWQKLLFLDLN